MIIVLKGGPNSGWFSPPRGTHSGEKHRAIGSGKAKKGSKIRLSSVGYSKVGTLPLRGKSKGKSAAYYKIDNMAPKTLRAADDVLLMIPLKGGPSYGISAGPSEMWHAVMASELGIHGREFDSYVRPAIDGGTVVFSTHTAGGLSMLDSTAERHIKVAAKRMISMGFPADIPASWQLRNNSVLRGLTLGDMAK